MQSLNLEEENIIKDIRNVFRLKKELSYIAIEDIRNLFRSEKETKAIKDRTLRHIKNLFEYDDEEEENFYKLVSNFWSYSYIKYESNGDKDKHYR